MTTLGGRHKDDTQNPIQPQSTSRRSSVTSQQSESTGRSLLTASNAKHTPQDDSAPDRPKTITLGIKAKTYRSLNPHQPSVHRPAMRKSSSRQPMGTDKTASPSKGSSVQQTQTPRNPYYNPGDGERGETAPHPGTSAAGGAERPDTPRPSEHSPSSNSESTSIDDSSESEHGHRPSQRRQRKEEENESDRERGSPVKKRKKGQA